MAMQALLDDGDEVLVPAPDYPLWTAAVSLAGGTAVHYRCDEQSDWMPDLADIERKVTDRTKAIVIINPNNPTGAVYDDEMLRGLTDIARRHNLLVCSDEIYDKILYDGATHTPTAADRPRPAHPHLQRLSKAYRVAGYRVGWMAVCGPSAHADSYIEGLTILANMRLCANMPAQHAVATALGGRQSINDLVLPGGRLLEQRDAAYELLTQIPGVTLREAEGRAVPLPAARPDRLQDQGRPADGPGPAARPRRSWSSRAPASTGPSRTTSGSSPCRRRRTCADAVTRIGTLPGRLRPAVEPHPDRLIMIRLNFRPNPS